MQSQNYPAFKQGYKYLNIGNIVGNLNYAKPMVKKDKVTEFGYEFLINAKGFGSINVRIPKMDAAQESLDLFPISDKPRVRAGLAKLEQFVTDNGKRYTNATCFVTLSDATTVGGEPMKDNLAGRLAGEVFNMQQIQGDNGLALAFDLVSYPTDNDGKLQVGQNGAPYDPNVIRLEVHQPQILTEFQNQGVSNGSNIEVGYRYFNKSNVKYDDFGYPINDPNDVIERVEVGKLTKVHSAAGGGQQGGFGGGQGQQGFDGQQQQQGGFGGQQQGFGNQGQQQGFGGQQQQQQSPPPQQPQQQQGFNDGGNNFGMQDNQFPFEPSYDPNNDPFGNSTVVDNQNNPFANQGQQNQDFNAANQFFGQGGQNGGFGGFGQ